MERARQLQEARARHAEQQFDKMCDCMLKVVQEAQGRLVPEERHMLYIAYKCAVGQQRHILKHDPSNGEAVNQINAFCGELIKVLASDLIPNGADDESKAFYYKIMGDFYRYLDNVGQSEDRKSQAQMAYQTAYDLSQRLPVCHPLRLNTALNFGVFYHEARGQCRTAYDITKMAIDNSRPVLASLPEQERTEASFVIDLMLDNMKSWGRELGIDGGEAGRGNLPVVRSSSGTHSAQQGGHHTYHFNATGASRGGVTQQHPGGYTPAHTPALGPTGVQTGAVYY